MPFAGLRHDARRSTARRAPRSHRTGVAAPAAVIDDETSGGTAATVNQLQPEARPALTRHDHQQPGVPASPGVFQRPVPWNSARVVAPVPERGPGGAHRQRPRSCPDLGAAA